MILKSFQVFDNFSDGVTITPGSHIKLKSLQSHQLTLPFAIKNIFQKAVAVIHQSSKLKSMGITIYPTLFTKANDEPLKITLKNITKQQIYLDSKQQIGYLICVSYFPITTVYFKNFKTRTQNNIVKCFSSQNYQIQTYAHLILECQQQINFQNTTFEGVRDQNIETYFKNDKILVCNQNNKPIVLASNSYVGSFISNQSLNIQINH